MFQKTTENSRPLHGGRGLKLLADLYRQLDHKSPPSRGARIETNADPTARNALLGRPLHGGRGLKLRQPPAAQVKHGVAPFTGGAD